MSKHGPQVGGRRQGKVCVSVPSWTDTLVKKKKKKKPVSDSPALVCPTALLEACAFLSR